MDPRLERQTRRRTWLGIVVGLGVAVGVGATVGALVLWGDPGTEPPPLRDLRAIDAGLEEDCAMVVGNPTGTEAPVYARPGLDELVTTSISNDTLLEVVSVRRDFVEVRLDGRVGWIERRYTKRVCDR